ncbi:hypothetical protein RTP6_005850 [Batrachochytrium dendrobatidis]
MAEIQLLDSTISEQLSDYIMVLQSHTICCISSDSTLSTQILNQLACPEWNLQNPVSYTFDGNPNSTQNFECSVSFELVHEGDVGIESSVANESIKQYGAVLLIYNINDRLTFFSMPALLDIIQELGIPVALLGCNAGSLDNERQVDYKLGEKLASVFGVTFVEFNLDSSKDDDQKSMFEAVCRDLVTHAIKITESSHPVDLSVNTTQQDPVKEHHDDAHLEQDTFKEYLRTMRRLSAQMQNTSGSKEYLSESQVQSQSVSASPSHKLKDNLYQPPTNVLFDPKNSIQVIPSHDCSVSNQIQPTSHSEENHTLASTNSQIQKECPKISTDEAYSSNSLARSFSDLPSHGSSVHTSVSNGSFTSTGERRRLYEGYLVTDIIERITSEDTHDMEFTKMILILFPKFLSPSEFLDRLLDRFDLFDYSNQSLNSMRREGRSGSIHPVQLRVCNVIIYWITNYPQDFHSEKMRFTLFVCLDVFSSRTEFSAISQRIGQLLSTLPACISENDMIDWGVPDLDVMSAEELDLSGLSISSHFDLHRSTDADISAAKSASTARIESSQTTHAKPFVSQLPFSVTLTFLSRAILENESDIIAQQLCLMEWNCFRCIKPRDLVHHLWSKKDKGKHAASVAQSVQLFNDISTWVMSSILSESEPKTRAKTIAKFMRICQWLKVFNNYNSLMAVIAGINSSSISRLKYTRQYVADQPGVSQFAALERLMSSEKSSANYRAALKHSCLPCIPYLGVFLRDLLYTHESHRDFRIDTTINLQKFVLMGDVILMITNFQIRPYDISPNLQITNMIANFPKMGEEEAFRRSLELEPRE